MDASKQTQLSEAFWNNLSSKLGLAPKKTNSLVKALGGGEYMIGNNKVMELRGVPEDVFLGYDWANGKLSFLTKGAWMAKNLTLQISGPANERVQFFLGTWEDGDFEGNMFGTFRGSSFIGKFSSAFESYESDPSTFVKGTINDHKRGVLGLAKLDSIALDDSSQRKHVSLLEMQPGYYCNLVDDQGKTHSFQMIKCCDNKSMDIELEEKTGQQRSIRILWEDIRKGNDPAMFRRLSSVRIGGRPQIPFLFANDRIGKVLKIEISPKPTMFGTTVDTYSLDTSLLRPLKYPLATTTIHLFDQKEIALYTKIFQDLVNNGMQLHLRNVLDGIKMGVITGWNGYPHLVDVFSRQEGAPVKHPKYADSMKWLDEFVQIIVLRMMRARMVGGVYVDNKKGRSILMGQLAETIAQVMPAATLAPTSSTSKGTPPPKPRKSMIPEAFGKVAHLIDKALRP